MCEHGDTVDVAVTIVADHSHTGEARVAVKPIDRCIAPLVEALSTAGLTMLGSCCGHGKGPGNVLLADGRRLVIERGPPLNSPVLCPFCHEPVDPCGDNTRVLFSVDFDCWKRPGREWVPETKPGVQVSAHIVCGLPAEQPEGLRSVQ